MPVPFPDPDDTELSRPDADEAAFLAQGVVSAVTPPGGLTRLQDALIRATFHSLVDHDVDPLEAPAIDPTTFAQGLARRNARFRMRVVQTMMLAELVLVPLPPEVAERVEAFASELSIDDAMLHVARRLSSGSLGLALIDFERNGYTATWDRSRSAHLHTATALDIAWQEACHDPDLAARWAGLEHCPAGSLGRGVFHFYRARGFTFPGLPGSAPPYLAQHDWVHVLADYGSTVESEIETFGLIARAIEEPRGFSLLAMVIGLFETGYLPQQAGLFLADRGHLSREGMAIRLADAMRRGALMEVPDPEAGGDLMTIDWFEWAKTPIDEVREAFALTPKSPEAVAAGSVGPWEPGGISSHQWSCGLALADAEGRRYDPGGACPP